VLAVVPINLKLDMERKGKECMIKLYDIFRINKYKVTSSNNRVVVVLKDAYDILKSGVKTKIGNPTLYDDCKSTSRFPKSDIKNTVLPESRPSYEEEKRQSRDAEKSPILRKSGVASKTVSDDYLPIRALNTMNPDWIIMAKVTNKGQIRTYTNNRGEGKLFNFELADSYGGQIQVTCFNRAAERFEPMIEKGKVYKISKGEVKMANKRFSSIPNDYCLILNEHASVELAEDEEVEIADLIFEFTPIEKLVGRETMLTIDFIGVVHEDMGTKEINTKTGTVRHVRTVLLVDDSKLANTESDGVAAVELNIWGDSSDRYQFPKGEIIGVKRCRTSEYRGGIRLNASEDDDVYFK